MGFLTTEQISALLAATRLVTPFDGRDVVPGGVDLRLGNRAYRYEFPDVYTLGDEAPAERVENFDRYTLEKGETGYIGLREKITMPTNLLGLLVPRSSVSRLGLGILPVVVHPGYSGTLPLTITNHTGRPVVLIPGIRVVQLVLFTTEGANVSYADQEGVKYQNEDVAPSRLHQDYDLDRVNAIIIEKFPFMAGKL